MQFVEVNAAWRRLDGAAAGEFATRWLNPMHVLDVSIDYQGFVCIRLGGDAELVLAPPGGGPDPHDVARTLVATLEAALSDSPSMEALRHMRDTASYSAYTTWRARNP
jgi:hypothetical protein